MSTRSTAGLAALGALLVVLAWAGWGAAHSSDPSQAPALRAVAMPPADVRSTTAQLAPRAALEATVAGDPSSAPADAQSVAPAVRDGFVMQHGMLTAMRSAGGAGRTPSAVGPDSVALPPGVRPEDVAVSPGGIVAVLRTGLPASPSATGDAAPVAAVVDAAANPFRPATATHAP